MKSIDLKFNNSKSYKSDLWYLLWLYFTLTFSYAHLPFAKYHHSLGSLFNYVGAIIVMLGVTHINRLRFNEKEVSGLLGCVVILIIAFVGQFLQAVFDGFDHTDPDLMNRSLKTVFTMLTPIISVYVIIVLAKVSDFTFSDLAKATRISIYILLAYLFVEVLGAKYQYEPFKGIVEFVSKYLNYRDEFAQLGGRLRGFSNEPSYMSVPIIFMASVLLIDRSLNNNKRYVLLGLMMVLSSVSLSKNLLIGLIVLLAVHALYYKKFVPFLFISIVVLVVSFYVNLLDNGGILWQYKNYGFDYSTLTRVGSWIAAYKGFLEYPVFGCGLGLAGRFIVDYYPKYFYLLPESGKWTDAAMTFSAPVFSNLFRNLFELGMMGVIWVAYLIYSLIRVSNSRRVFSHDNFILITGFILSYSMVDILTFWPWFVLLGIRRMNEEIR